MAFKPSNSGKRPAGGTFERNVPTPKSGSRKARVSLIVDLGIQQREDFEDEKTGEVKPQKPCQQIAMYVDLVNDVVDYGGNIGKRQYRLALNKTFNGTVQGINFTTVPPKDGDGNLVQGKPWSFHPANVITKVAKVTELEKIIYDDQSEHALDISLLLDQPLMVTVEVKETEDKNGKKDDEGNVIVYKNVYFKGVAPVPKDDDENPVEVKPLQCEAKCITFDNATKEDIAVLRPSLIKMIKLANNYAGSQMQKAIEAFEKENGGEKSAPAKAPQKEEKKASADKSSKDKKSEPQKTDTGFDDMDDDVPF